ncbi:MAG: sugar phosphate isomerase/epimerase family protein [Terracidiphilus sp.]
MELSRRKFLAGTAAATMFAGLARAAGTCPFRVAVINDEISQDFDHACFVAAHDFGLQWIELRGMWNKNLTELDANQIAEAKTILAKYNLRVTDIASPLFKVDWPGAPVSKSSERRDQFGANAAFSKQDALLDHCIDLAKTFGTDRIRCFDFWRLDHVKPYREPINEKLREAARRCAKSNLILLLENEMSCNTATGVEAADTLGAISEPNFMLNWDPGNAATFPDSRPYPDGYDLLPKDRIGHCHAKNVVRKGSGKWEWAPVGTGVVDWVAQLHALARDGYHYAVSLETHWRGAGTPEASSRVSMQGLKDALAKAGTGC